MTNENEENFYQCPYCKATYDDPDSRDDHVFQNHMDMVEQKLSEISKIGEEHSQTIQEWRDSKKRELLLKISQEQPQLLHILQTSPESESMLEKMVSEDLFKKALKVETLSSFDAMWLRHPKFEEIYKASREKPEHQPQSGQSTGQDEQFFESPDAMIDTTKRTNTRENLSDEDRERMKILLILNALMRKQKRC
jgi:hypothetical protein